MTAVDLTTDIIDRYLKDVGDEQRAFFKEDGTIAEAFALTGGSYNAAVARGLFWMYQAAVNVPADMSGMDPQDRKDLITMRRGAYQDWLKMPAPADAPTEGVGHRKPAAAPPIMFATVPARRWGHS